MGEKSEQKKQIILEAAWEVFSRKGFAGVTMKDLVEASEISRGGLYLYFKSTEEVFLEILKLERQAAADAISAMLEGQTAAADVLLLFLKEQKKEIMGKTNNLSLAISEYFFWHKPEKKENLLKKWFDSSVNLLEHVIELGVDSGEFCAQDPRGAARNAMYVVEGLKSMAQTIGISEATVDREMLYIMEQIVGDTGE